MKYYLVIFVLLLVVSQMPVAQDSPILELGIPVSGTLAVGESADWQFTHNEPGDVVSIMVQATSGTLDPVLRIFDSDGVLVTWNDDFNYPENSDAIVEAMTVPQAGTYTVEVSSFADTTGNFTLTLLPGYGNIEAIDRFEGTTRWQSPNTDSNLSVENNAGQLQIELSGIQKAVTITPATGEIPLTAYVTLQIQAVASAENWQVGMTIRQQDADSYYAFKVNNQGAWRFVLNTNLGEVIIRDWSNHPALVPGQYPFTLSVLSDGTHFDVFYNDAYLATIVDDTLTQPGTFGVFVATANALGSELQATIDNYIITTPTQSIDQPMTTTRITSQESDDIIRELRRRQLIAEGGQLTANIGESFAQFVQPGVSRFPLIQNPAYKRLAIGATITIESAQDALVGCGITIHDVSDEEYLLAYVDNSGGYGLSHFADNIFEPGLFGEHIETQSDQVDLLLIAESDVAYYFVDHQFAGSLPLPTTSGQINNAVVNFDPSDTTCTFRDVWLWSWD